MLNISKKLGLFALVCTLAGLAGCGGSSGTDNKKVDLLVCSGTDVIIDGVCAQLPEPEPCEPGYYRPTRTAACEKADFVLPTKPAVLAPDEAVVYINRANIIKDFTGYSLYTWQACGGGWLSPSSPDVNGIDNWTSETINPLTGNLVDADPVYGAYFIVKLKPGGTCGNFIIRTPGRTTQSANLEIKTAGTGPLDRRFFVIENPETGLVGATTSKFPICINNVCEEYEKPALAISDVSAHWVTPSVILWDKTVTDVKLYAADEGATITAATDGSVLGGTLVGELSAGSISADDLAATPHLSNFKPYSFTTALSAAAVKDLVKKELVIVGESVVGKVGTRIQNYALLDALYTKGTTELGTQDANEAKLGVAYSEDGAHITVSVWAPTAKNVELRIFNDVATPSVDGSISVFPLVKTVTMNLDSATGIWSYAGTAAELNRKYYRFRVTGYNQFSNSTNILEVPDPYAVSLAADGLYSQIVNLNDDDLKPAGWDNPVPEVASPEAMTIYETHIRDFSIRDESTPAEHRGKYLAFTHSASAPVKHLIELQKAGLTHIHLLPINDGSSIRESAGQKYNLGNKVNELCSFVSNASVCANKGERDNVNANNIDTLLQTLQSYPGDSDKARKLMESLGGIDSFNWNYDPQFFNAPEGSYATNPNGVTRIVEVRAMNTALHNLGLRVVLDVVYPHMAASGIETANSTFDKIVPGYYFRINTTTGAPITDTGAGPDTALERVMMGKFLSDSVTQWAEQYKVDGFRFDQSGFIPKSVLVDAYKSVQAVDADNYFYAEAWNAAGSNASSRVPTLSNQANLAGTGIGTFNDRIRNPLRTLAIVNGGELNAVRAGLAGNLADFRLLTKDDVTIVAESVGAYNEDPQEAINYVEKHDQETLWDWMHLPNALPADTSLANRVRIQDLTLSVPLLSQGVPFIQMGSELLRSKSMDADSYNSGDWFNYVDFTKNTNNWAVGLPTKRTATDAQIIALFADPNTKPTPDLIQQSSTVFNEFLAISKSPLFSLQTATEVIDRVGFHDGGPSQVANVIVMSIDDGEGVVAGTDDDERANLDSDYDAIVVVFNGTNATIERKIRTAEGFTLHPVQQASVDAVVRTASFAPGTGADSDKGVFTVPAYTTAVFVKKQNGSVQGEGLLSSVTSGYEAPAPFGDSLYVRGSVFDNDWTAQAGNKMTYKKGIYSATLTFGGTKEFKVADSTFAGPTTFGGPGSSNYSLVLGTAFNTASPGQNIVIAAPATAAGYTFELNANDPLVPVMTVYEAADVYHATSLYVRGSVHGDWATSDTTKLSYETLGVYSKTINIPNAGNYAFKIADSAWTGATIFGSGGGTVTLGTPLTTASPGDNVEFNAATAGDYKFTLDTTTTPHKITVTKVN